MRLIDADALSFEGTITDIVEDIINAPTIEQFVKRGAWCCVQKSPPKWKCSQCSEYMPNVKNWLEPHPNFCPNCGADMRMGESDDK